MAPVAESSTGVFGITRTTTRPVDAGSVTMRASTTLRSAAATFTTVWRVGGAAR